MKKEEEKKAHRPHRAPVKTVQIDKHIWLYQNIDLEKKRIIKYFMKIERFFIWTNLNPFIQGCFVPNFIEIASLIREEKIF